MGKVKTAVIIVILVALVGGYYFYLTNVGKNEEQTVVTAVQDVLLRNLENDYPPTPREVMKYYSDITKCLYNETYTEEQLEQMADKLLALYDDELAENNPRDQYLVSLKNEVQEFAHLRPSWVYSSTSVLFDCSYYSVVWWCCKEKTGPALEINGK